MNAFFSFVLTLLFVKTGVCDIVDGATKPTPTVKVCGTKSPFDDPTRTKIIEYHNKLRGDIAKGKAANISGNLPSAKNMYALRYDCKMENRLQEKLKTCEVPKFTFNQGYGQNIIKIDEKKFSAIKTVEQRVLIALESWSNPILYYGIEKSEKVLKYDDARLYTFANMIYAKALTFACGYFKCKDDVYISCIYNLVGGYKGSELYEYGSSCNKNDDCTTYKGSRCDKTKGLCTYSGKIPHPGGGKNTQCKGNDEMDDRARDAILDAHNLRRSLLARGLVQNGQNNDKLPTSQFMPKMMYDCNVESTAIKHAKSCSFKKSDENERKGYGENVFVYPIPNADPVPAFKAAATSWWAESTVETIGGDVKFTETLKTKANQTAFTQMAWARSIKLGCAIQTCSFSSFIVCRYSPQGNIVNENIYEIGYVCSGCSSACNSTEGLCKLYGSMI